MLLLLALLRLLSLGVCLLLAIFALRRLLFTATLLLRQSPAPASFLPPTVLVLVPARDEAPVLPGLFRALQSLDYPAGSMRVILIDDGSADGTGRLMEDAVAVNPGWSVLRLPVALGKAEALNRAVGKEEFGEILYVFDADHSPDPDCLRQAVVAFSDPSVAGVSGRMLVTNWWQSPLAYYAKIESMVHQLVTMRGKDLLGLGPALLGSNNGVRRVALAQVGGFRGGSLLEDGDLTLSLCRRGFRLRYLPGAVSRHRAPLSTRGYLRQHGRWGRGFIEIAGLHLGGLIRDARLPAAMRLELALFSLGYLDRVAWTAGLVLLGVDPSLGAGLWPLLLAALLLGAGMPMLQVLAVLAFDRAGSGLWIRLPLLPLLFGLDLAAAAGALLSSALGLERRWHRTPRAD